jgi:hypothetical protein
MTANYWEQAAEPADEERERDAPPPEPEIIE